MHLRFYQEHGLQAAPIYCSTKIPEVIKPHNSILAEMTEKENVYKEKGRMYKQRKEYVDNIQSYY